MARLQKVCKACRQGQARTLRAVLIFPLCVLQCLLIQRNLVTDIAPVYLAAVLEFITAELVDVAGNAAHENNKKRINPRYLELSINDDLELSKLIKGVINK